ncbi:TetR family transcriptional regulator [Kribbella sp. VKM Ac-2527]|uniref:TetR family transcriptional regulator n=1 Tax=Kribbella caucasensis TaxID=2512215 RepID=A0A4V3C5G8_9ACTN|nr:TetR/AcrR family transcriptional regulator [Kribbella sp. VKM Ac-2527]TDO29838.1 TetR family transcriptional regulator [Kribbella sp. VKM Ac-2527]
MADVKHFDPDRVLGLAELVFWRRGAGSTGIQDVLTATGLSRSSLYNTFGGKEDLYELVMRRYLDQRSRPMFARLAADRRGLPAISSFFSRLIGVRCSGEFAGWGCLVSNAHLEDSPVGAKVVLDEHQAALSIVLHAALKVADDKHQLRPGLDLAATAEHLTLLAYAINLRSRAGVQAEPLQAAVRAALAPLVV